MYNKSPHSCTDKGRQQGWMAPPFPTWTPAAPSVWSIKALWLLPNDGVGFDLPEQFPSPSNSCSRPHQVHVSARLLLQQTLFSKVTYSSKETEAHLASRYRDADANT
ncbi:hypothetical protein GN956_G20701 [Arapaima gigas]